MWIWFGTQNQTESPNAVLNASIRARNKQPTYHIKLWTEASNHLANLHVKANKQPRNLQMGRWNPWVEWPGFWAWAWLQIWVAGFFGVAACNPIRKYGKSSRNSSSNRVSQNKIKIKAKFNLSKIDYRPIMCSLRVPHTVSSATSPYDSRECFSSTSGGK